MARIAFSASLRCASGASATLRSVSHEGRFEAPANAAPAAPAVTARLAPDGWTTLDRPWTFDEVALPWQAIDQGHGLHHDPYTDLLVSDMLFDTFRDPRAWIGRGGGGDDPEMRLAEGSIDRDIGLARSSGGPT